LLVRTGTPVEQLTLSDAADLASRQTGTTVTTGSGYPRFGDQDGYRLAVLEAFLDDGPSYSDIALNGVSQAIQELGDGKSEFLDADDVPKLIETVAADHEEAMRGDRELALRLYAIWRLKADRSERSLDQLAKLREREELVNKEWAGIVETLARELGASPLADLEYTDFEIALTSLRTGLLARQATTGIPDGILGRLVGTLVLGFFEEARTSKAQRKTVPQKLAEFLSGPSMRRKQRARRETIRKLAADSVRRLSPISDDDLDAAGSPAVRRALETIRQGGKGL
jgi:hypothetical protein